jgi:hypothetical protein
MVRLRNADCALVEVKRVKSRSGEPEQNSDPLITNNFVPPKFKMILQAWNTLSQEKMGFGGAPGVLFDKCTVHKASCIQCLIR